MSVNSNKKTILQLLNNKHYSQALQQSSAWLARSPQNADALYLSGLSHLLTERYAKSIHQLTLAIQQNPDDARFTANLGIAYLRSGDINSAIGELKKAIAMQPAYQLAYYNLGSAYIKNKQAELAVDAYRFLTQCEPENADYICALADAIRETGQWQQAITLYKKALTYQPKHYRAHTNMGLLMMHLGKINDAITHCQQAIALEPNKILARKNLGDCYLQKELLDEAMDCYADAFEIIANERMSAEINADEENAQANNKSLTKNSVENAELCIAIAEVWLETADLGEASSWFKKARQFDSENICALCGLANIERETGNINLALSQLTTLHKKAPDNIKVLLALADTLWDDGDTKTALQHLKTVQTLQPQRSNIHAKIAHLLASSGDIDNANKQCEIALQQNPHCIPALNNLATTQRHQLKQTHFNTLKKLLKKNARQTVLKNGALASLHNSLAFYYDGIKNYNKAATHMNLANHFQWQHKKIRGWQYQTAEHEKYCTGIINSYTEEYFKKSKNLENRVLSTDEIIPVFIVSMPRSGTTLSEQILSRHKNILGIGERNFATQSFNQLRKKYSIDTHSPVEHSDILKLMSAEDIQETREKYLKELKQLIKQSNKADITHVVDKMPDNYSLLGWINTLFPQAKIIHLQRHPNAVALSCWKTQFGSIKWACKEEHLTHRIKQYQRLMQHWRETLADYFIELNYEDLVNNQLHASQRLIEYLGLNWDENCLKFYESDRIIRTASISQVRQPIYQNSVARWQKYRPLLPELFQALSK